MALYHLLRQVRSISLTIFFASIGSAQASHDVTHPGTLAVPSIDQAAAPSAALRHPKHHPKRRRRGGAARQRCSIKESTWRSARTPASITPRSIPENQPLLKSYSAAGRNGGLVKFRVGDIDTLPGLLGIANQIHRAQDSRGQNAQSYTLADAMTDAIWRKNTAARLKAITASQRACADIGTQIPSSIGLFAVC